MRMDGLAGYCNGVLQGACLLSGANVGILGAFEQRPLWKMRDLATALEVDERTLTVLCQALTHSGVLPQAGLADEWQLSEAVGCVRQRYGGFSMLSSLWVVWSQIFGKGSHYDSTSFRELSRCYASFENRFATAAELWEETRCSSWTPPQDPIGQIVERLFLSEGIRRCLAQGLLQRLDSRPASLEELAAPGGTDRDESLALASVLCRTGFAVKRDDGAAVQITEEGERYLKAIGGAEGATCYAKLLSTSLQTTSALSRVLRSGLPVLDYNQNREELEAHYADLARLKRVARTAGFAVRGS
jgi:hypothetical protein